MLFNTVNQEEPIPRWIWGLNRYARIMLPMFLALFPLQDGGYPKDSSLNNSKGILQSMVFLGLV